MNQTVRGRDTPEGRPCRAQPAEHDPRDQRAAGRRQGQRDPATFQTSAPTSAPIVMAPPMTRRRPRRSADREHPDLAAARRVLRTAHEGENVAPIDRRVRHRNVGPVAPRVICAERRAGAGTLASSTSVLPIDRLVWSRRRRRPRPGRSAIRVVDSLAPSPMIFTSTSRAPATARTVAFAKHRCRRSLLDHPVARLVSTKKTRASGTMDSASAARRPRLPPG